jgi:hypothetical protein
MRIDPLQGNEKDTYRGRRLVQQRADADNQDTPMQIAIGSDEPSIIVPVYDLDGSPWPMLTAADASISFARHGDAAASVAAVDLADVDAAHQPGGIIWHAEAGGYRIDLPPAAAAAGALGGVVVLSGLGHQGRWSYALVTSPDQTISGKIDTLLGRSALPAGATSDPYDPSASSIRLVRGVDYTGSSSIAISGDAWPDVTTAESLTLTATSTQTGDEGIDVTPVAAAADRVLIPLPDELTGALDLGRRAYVGSLDAVIDGEPVRLADLSIEVVS